MNLPTHQLTMTVLMSPDMANFSGNVHGGAILKLLDQVAYACASRYASRYVVTLSVDRVLFLQAIHVGELVTFLASVNYTGKSSMEVGIKVIAENIRTQEVRHVNSCFFTSTSGGMNHSGTLRPSATSAAHVQHSDHSSPCHQAQPCRRCSPKLTTKSAVSKRPKCAKPCATSSKKNSARPPASPARPESF